MYMNRLHAQVIINDEFTTAYTQQGQVRGIYKDKTFIFRGVQYAQAKRFHLPTVVKPWEGIRDAVSYGYVCPELNSQIPQDQQLVPHLYLPQNEHCQFLNIWTPSMDSASKLPVVVWMHGGGWNSGSSVEQFAYDGEHLSKAGNVVFVSFNSRQNCLGALDLSLLDDEYAQSNKAGMGDVLLAMKWIQSNIQAFGGDAGNVTVVGQAGGAKKALALMQSPSADGLYHKMAIGSGAGEQMQLPEGYTHKQVNQLMGKLVAIKLGLTRDTLHQIEEIPYWRLSAAVKSAEKELKKEVPDRFRWEPLPDGISLFDSPFHTGFRKETAGVPMMFGSSLGEMENKVYPELTRGYKAQLSQQELDSRLLCKFGAGLAKVQEAHLSSYPDADAANLLFVDTQLRKPICHLAQQRAHMNENVWNWLFALESPINGGTVAWHCSETPYITRNADYFEACFVPATSDVLQEQMSGAWAAFAHTGNPNHSALPNWQQVTEGQLHTMIFDKETALRLNHDVELQRELGNAISKREMR